MYFILFRLILTNTLGNLYSFNHYLIIMKRLTFIFEESIIIVVIIFFLLIIGLEDYGL